VNAIGTALAGANATGYWYYDKAVAQDAGQEATEFHARNLMPFVRAQAENVLLGTEGPRAAVLEDASDQ
jgi:hypothetical protein